MRQQPFLYEGTITKTVRLNSLLYLPPEYGDDTTTRLPLILFLHGAGERGDDLNILNNHGIPRLLAQGRDLPFVIVSPQCPPNSEWSLHMDALTALLDHMLDTYRIDRERVYLTGLSMGGRGAWLWAALNTERLAALAPICGRRPDILRNPPQAARLKDLPIWVFHGAQDKIVPVEESLKMVEALEACGGKPRLTVYPDAGHDSWTRTYDNAELYEWFLRQRRGGYQQ